MNKLNTLFTAVMLWAAIGVNAQVADAPIINIVDGISCQAGDPAVINISGNLNSAENWYVYTGSCGGTLVTSTIGGDVELFPSANTTYYVRGEGATVADGACASVDITFTDILDQTVALDNDLINCAGATVNVMLGGSQADMAYLVRNDADGTVLSTDIGTGAALNIPVVVDQSMDINVLATPVSTASVNNTYINLQGGSDYVLAPHASQLDLTDQFIFSFKFKSSNASQTQKYLFSKGLNRYAVIYGYEANTIELFGGAVDVRTGSQITVPDMDWHQYVYTYDGATLKGYIDGVEVVNVAKSITLSTDAQGLFIGAANSTAGNFEGYLDNLEIWNQYNTTRIAELLAGGCSAITDYTGLAALYLFEDGSGTVASDHSGYSNHGTLYNVTAEIAWQAHANPYECITCSEQLSQTVSVVVDNPTITTQPVSAAACSGDALSFFIETSDVVDSVVWQADGRSNGANWYPASNYPNVSLDGNTIDISAISGTHHGFGFRAVIYKCGIPQDTSSVATITVHGYAPTPIYTEVCSEYVTSNGTVITDPGVYADTLVGVAASGCDSIFWVNLKILNENVPHRTIYPNTCSFVGPSGATFNGPGIEYDILLGAHPGGCDSIIAIDFRPVCDTITDYRLLAGSNDNGNGKYYFYSSLDSSRITEKSTLNTSFQAFTIHPASGYLHAVIDSLGDGNMKLYEFNPFTSEMTLLYEFPEPYVASADYGPDGTLYFVYGWNAEDMMQIWKLDSARSSLEFLCDLSSEYDGMPNLEYFDSNGTLRMYEYDNRVYEIDLATGDYTLLEATGLTGGSIGLMPGVMMGAFHNSTRGYTSLVDMNGTFFITDETGLSGREIITDDYDLTDIVEFNTLFPMQDNLLICQGDSVQLSVRYHANTIHWYKDEVLIATNEDTIYVSDAGTYKAMHQIGTQNKWVLSEEKTVETRVSSLDNSVTQDGNTLTANDASLYYQWIDCSTELPIDGETNQSFTGVINGSYAVEVSDGICKDTSACIPLVVTGIEDELSGNIKLYPNPTSSEFTVSIPQEAQLINLEIYNSLGQKVYKYNGASGHQLNLQPNLTQGLYLVHIETDKGTIIKNLIIK